MRKEELSMEFGASRRGATRVRPVLDFLEVRAGCCLGAPSTHFDHLVVVATGAVDLVDSEGATRLEAPAMLDAWLAASDGLCRFGIYTVGTCELLIFHRKHRPAVFSQLSRLEALAASTVSRLLDARIRRLEPCNDSRRSRHEPNAWLPTGGA